MSSLYTQCNVTITIRLQPTLIWHGFKCHFMLCIGGAVATGTFALRYLFSSVKQVKYSLQNFVFHCKNEAKTSPQVTPLHAITNGLIGFLPSFDIHFPNPVTLSTFVSRPLSVINTFRRDIVDG